MVPRYRRRANPVFGGPPRNWPYTPDPREKHPLSKILQVYLDAEHLYHSPKYAASIKMVIENAIGVIGDRCIKTIRAIDIKTLTEDGIQRHFSPSNILHHLYLLHGAVKFYLNERAIMLSNPFSRPTVAGAKPGYFLGQAPQQSDLIEITSICLAKDDEIRWLLALLLDTGARCSEIVGLALDDIHLDSPVPFVSIRHRPWRPLKTRFSSRDIPLVGMALWAASRLREHTPPGERYLFPRYVPNGTMSATAHKTLDVCLRAHGFLYGVHALRQAFAQRLRDVGCDPEVRAALLGIKFHWHLGTYGYGYRIPYLHQKMLPISLQELGSATAPRTSYNGYDRRLSPYECGLVVMRQIELLECPNLRSILAASTLARVDTLRGLRHAKAHGVVYYEGPSTRAGVYRLTGEALPVTPQGVRSKRRKMPPLLANAYLRERRRGRQPDRGSYPAACFPPHPCDSISRCGVHHERKRRKLAGEVMWAATLAYARSD